MFQAASGEGETRNAGDFSVWLREMRAALRGDGSTHVPCAGCTACCTSFQFVHIGPEETDTLAHIPSQLLVPAPGMPSGYLVLGYDQRGHCPMLIEGQCSIYEHRPRTCRTYDCRVFTAAGVEPDEPSVAARSRQWRFDYTQAGDRALHEAIRSLARDHRRPDARASETAVRAVEEGLDP